MPYFRTVGSPDTGCARKQALNDDMKKMFRRLQEQADSVGDGAAWEATKSAWMNTDAGFLGMFRTQGERDRVKWLSVSDSSLMRLNNFSRMNVRGSHMRFEEPSERAYIDPRNEYWRIRRYYNGIPSAEANHMNLDYHPLIVPTVESFMRNSELRLHELDFEFDLCKKSDGSYYSSAVYFGDSPRYLRHWYSNGTPSIDYNEYVLEDRTWEDHFRRARNDDRLFKDYVLFLRNISRMKRLDLIFCDYNIEGKVDISKELQNNYFLFKQMFHSFERLEEGGKMVVRIPSMFHQVTRDIIILFAAHFERYKFMKPISTPLGCEDVYVCFDNKRFFRDNQESILFLASLNLYWDEYNKTNAISKKTDSLTISTIFSHREITIFEEHLGKTGAYFDMIRDYMRSEYIDVQAFLKKRRFFSTDERKMLTDRFYTYLELNTAFEEDMVQEPSDKYIIPESNVIVVEEHLESIPLDKPNKELLPHQVLEILIKAKVLLPDFPKAELITNHGFIKDLLAFANKKAYSMGDVDIRPDYMIELSRFNNDCKKLLLDHMKHLETVIDLACGKGVDIQKYSGGSSNVTNYIGIDVSLSQLTSFQDRKPMVKFNYDLYEGDFTQPKILPGLKGRTLIAAFNVFSLLCTSKLTFNSWLRYNFRYRDIFLVGSCLSDSVKNNKEYIKKFSCKFNGNLMQYSIPGLVRDAYEYVLDLEEVRRVAVDAQLKMIVFDRDKFPGLTSEISPLVSELTKDIRYVILCKHDAVDDLQLRKFWTNIANPNYVLR